jgi:phosphotriesterase-related protein
VLFHEHLSARWGRPQHFTDDVALIAAEVKASRADGIACIVDAGHADLGRSLDALTRIATDSGMPVVASGGYYTQRLFPPDLAAKSEDALTEELVQDAARYRFGAFGEIGQELGEMTADERKVFRAVGRAHVRTGLPIFTHSPYVGTRAKAAPVPRDTALRHLDLLESVGVAPVHVALGHMCCLDDPKAVVAQQVAKRGAFVGFDRVTLEGILPDTIRVEMVRSLIDAGYADQLLLSSDFYLEGNLKKRGGPGLGLTVTKFGPKLIEAGVPEATLRRILSDNPRRFLAFAR